MKSTLLAALTLALAAACGPAPSDPTPLAQAGALHARTSYRQVNGNVSEVTFLLTPAADCPVLDATFWVNGVQMGQGPRGGEESGGTYYFMPTTRCVTPEYRAGASSGGGLDLVLEDSSARFRQSSAGALGVAFQLNRQAFRAGEEIAFTAGQPLAGLEGVEFGLVLRREGDSQNVQQSKVGLPSYSGRTASLRAPALAPGRYLWFLSVRAASPIEVCEGFASCAEVWGTIYQEGVLELLP